MHVHELCFTPRSKFIYALIGELHLIANVYDRKTVYALINEYALISDMRLPTRKYGS